MPLVRSDWLLVSSTVCIFTRDSKFGLFCCYSSRISTSRYDTPLRLKNHIFNGVPLFSRHVSGKVNICL